MNDNITMNDFVFNVCRYYPRLYTYIFKVDPTAVRQPNEAGRICDFRKKHLNCRYNAYIDLWHYIKDNERLHDFWML